MVAGCEAENFIRDFIDRVRQRDGRSGEESLCREAFAELACKDRYRGDLPENDETVLALVEQLLACRNPHTAPSGKPTLTEIGWKEWNQRFRE